MSIKYETPSESPYRILAERTEEKHATLETDIAKDFVDQDGHFDEYGRLVVYVYESFLLAMVAEGVNITSPKIVSALKTSIEHVVEKLPDQEQEEHGTGDGIDTGIPTDGGKTTGNPEES